MTDQPLDKPQEDEDDFESHFGEFAKSSDTERDEYNIDRDKAREDQEAELKELRDSSDDEDEPPKEPDVAERLKTLESENERLRHSDASQRGRLGAYQRQINELQRAQQEQKAAKPTNEDGKPQSDDQQKTEMAESMGVDDWEEFKEDFPDMARAFEARLKADQQKQAQLERRVEELQSAVQPIQEQAHQQHLQSEFARLEARHENWREVVNAPQFREWLQSQNPGIQQLAESDSADDASALLDFFKGSAGAGDADNDRASQHDKRQSRLANAQTVSRRGAAQKGGAPEDFDAAFEHYARKRR